MTGEGKKGRELDSLEAEGPDVGSMHEIIYKELQEPKDGREPPPTWLIFFYIVLMGLGGWYLGTYSGQWRGDVYDEHPGAGGPAASSQAAAPVDPMVLGRRVYNNCMACHQKDGKGVPGNYPPLAGSELLNSRPEVPIAIVLHGLEGPVTVLGETYDQVMPKWDHLSDEQIAAVITHERASWGNQAPPVSPEMVAAVRKVTERRMSAWRAEEVEELKVSMPNPSAEFLEGPPAEEAGG